MILGCFQSKMERFTNNQNTLQESFLNICSQKIQHMKLKLQMLTGKHSILCSTGRWIFFSFVFNKQHMNKRTIHILELGMEKNTVWSGEIHTRDMVARASTKQAPSPALWGFENFKKPKVGPEVPLNAPHSHLFLYITQNYGSTILQEEAFYLSIG